MKTPVILKQNRDEDLEIFLIDTCERGNLITTLSHEGHCVASREYYQECTPYITEDQRHQAFILLDLAGYTGIIERKRITHKEWHKN